MLSTQAISSCTAGFQDLLKKLGGAGFQRAAAFQAASRAEARLRPGLAALYRMCEYDVIRLVSTEP